MNENNTNRQGLIPLLLIFWASFVLFFYVRFHPEHYRIYYHLIFLGKDVFIFLFLMFVCVGSGGFVLQRIIRWRADSLLLEVFISFSLGFGMLSYITMALGFLGIYSSAILISVLIVLLLAGIRQIKDFVVRCFEAFSKESRLIFATRLGIVLVLILAGQAGMNLVESMTPPYEWDTLSYHLECQKEYIRAGRIIELPFIHQSYYPCGVELVYGISMLLQSHVAPKLIHCFLGILAVLLIYDMGRRFFSRITGLVAALIFYTCPLPTWFSGVGKNDLGLIFFFTLTIYVFLLWWHSDRTEKTGRGALLALCAVLTGICIHLDYRGMILLFVIVLFLLFHMFFVRGERRSKVASYGMLIVIPAILIGSPWYIRNYILTNGGSPFFPFFTSQLGGYGTQAFDAEIVQLVQKYKMSLPPLIPARSIWYYLALPFWQFTIIGRNYDLARFNATITPLYLLLIPLFLFVKKQCISKELLGIGLVYILLTQLTRSNHTRYVVPIFPVLALVAGYVVHDGFSRTGTILRGVVWGIVGVVVAGLMYDSCVTFIRHRSLEYVAATIPERDYLTLRCENFPAVMVINEELPADARILFLSDERIYYCTRPAIPLIATRLAQFVSLAGEHDLEEWNAWLDRQGITHILYNPGFHRGFEQVRRVSNIVDSFFERYKRERLEQIYNRHGIEVYRVKQDI